MLPSVPIATDNIYKFACLFGVAIFISSMLGAVYLTVKFNELAFKNVIELSELRATENILTPEITKTKVAVLERQLAINKADRNLFEWLLAFIIAGSGGFTIWGFGKWYRAVQPQQDKLLNLQIEKTEREIQLLDKQLAKKDTE